MKNHAMQTCEDNLCQVLTAITDAGLDGQSIRDHEGLYDRLGEAAYNFFGKVALSPTNRNLIQNVIDQDMDAVVDSCTMKFLARLDAVLNIREPERIPFLVRLANNQIIDLARSDHRYHDRSQTMDELAWSAVRDETNLEEDYAARQDNRQAALAALELLGQTRPLEFVAVLTGGPLELKVSALGQLLREQGLRQVTLGVIAQICQLYQVSPALFSQVASRADRDDSRFEELSDKALSARISRAGYNGRQQVQRGLTRREDLRQAG